MPKNLEILMRLKELLTTPSIFIYYAERIPKILFSRLLSLDYKIFKTWSFYPREIAIVLFNGCNCRCRMCDIGQSLLKKEQKGLIARNILSDEPSLELEDWCKLVNEAHFFQSNFIFTGTEPFLFKDVIKLAKYIVDRKLKLHITTNGLLLKSFAKELVEIGSKWLNITVSIDGLYEKHDYIRGVPGLFEQVLEGIFTIHEYKKEFKKNFPDIFINFTITPYNFSDLSNFYNFFNKELYFAIKKIYFSHYWFKNPEMVEAHNKIYGERFPIEISNFDNNLLKIDTEVLLSEIRKLLNLKKKKIPFSINPPLSLEDIKIYYEKPLKKVGEYNTCIAPWKNITINFNGDVFIQGMCFFPKIGNIKNSSLVKLWNSSQIRDFREFIRKNKITPACLRCCLLFQK